LIMGEHRDHVVDITSTFARKVQAVRAHTSQFGKHPDVEGFLRGLADRAGAPFSMPLAESFKRLTLS
jgi:LmbE family N-acetylglucosaminyl deacetylase